MSDKYFGAHEFQAREEGVKLSSDRSFGLVFAGLFALLGTLSLYQGGTRWYYWFPLAALFGVLAYTAPRVLAPLNRLWAKFGHLLHVAISPILLGIVFYLCISPIGFLMRLTGKDGGYFLFGCSVLKVISPARKSHAKKGVRHLRSALNHGAERPMADRG
jgi:Saxitoxin biosynthesis operon protein SxtJ